MAMLKSIHIQGFKSIRDARVELGRVNVLIGANASGKSNLVAFFRMLSAITHHRLQDHVPRFGGADAILRNGWSATASIRCQLAIDTNLASEYRYSFRLEPTADGRLFFESETFIRPMIGSGDFPPKREGGNRYESNFTFMAEGSQYNEPTRSALSICLSTDVYVFHDTSLFSAIRQKSYLSDSAVLNWNGSNLAAVLHKFFKTKPAFYRRIVAAVRQVFPQFDDFVLEPEALDPNSIRLNWRERGQDTLFGPHQFSDGTLRFIALATLLLQPEDELPKVIVIDEPELGLHPNAIAVLAALIHKASHHSQLIVATQSVTLLDQFDPEEIIVVERDRVHNATEFRRLDAPSLTGWLEEYTLGDLWRKNVIGGGPN